MPIPDSPISPAVPGFGAAPCPGWQWVAAPVLPPGLPSRWGSCRATLGDTHTAGTLRTSDVSPRRQTEPGGTDTARPRSHGLVLPPAPWIRLQARKFGPPPMPPMPLMPQMSLMPPMPPRMSPLASSIHTALKDCSRQLPRFRPGAAFARRRGGPARPCPHPGTLPVPAAGRDHAVQAGPAPARGPAALAPPAVPRPRRAGSRVSPSLRDLSL